MPVLKISMSGLKRTCVPVRSTSAAGLEASVPIGAPRSKRWLWTWP
jgi:hypothetical protein